MSLGVFQLSIIRLLQYDWLSGYWRVMNTVTRAIETRFLNIYSTFFWPLMNECILNIIVVFASDLILTSGLNGLNWRLPIGWWYPGGHMTKRRGCQGQFESDSHGVQLNFNMFYNLRRSSPKAYAIMHKRGLISLPSVAEVEEPGNDSPHNNTSQQNAADQDNDSQSGPSNQLGDEPDSGSESEAELLWTMEELRKVRQDLKVAMQAEKERLARELAEMIEGPDSDTVERTQTEIGEGQGQFPTQAHECQQQGQGRSWRRNSSKHQQKIGTQRDNKEQANREWPHGPKWTFGGGRLGVGRLGSVRYPIRRIGARGRPRYGRYYSRTWR